MKKLNWLEISVLYIGSIMGAGFASGRECWQFFGVFGNKGYLGALIVTLGFVTFGLMMTYIARSKNTSDIGKLISPFNNKTFDNIFGIILAAFYLSDVIVMTAAGGSLLNQQFGLNKAVGGIIITILITVTVLGNFERISGIFSYLIPLLFGVVVIMIILVLCADVRNTSDTYYKPGTLSPNWFISSIVFLSYNTLALPAMSGKSAVTSKNAKNAYIGAFIGCVFLGLLIITQLRALLLDVDFTAAFDLPLLGYSVRFPKYVNVIYTLTLFGFIYSTGSSLYYGFTTKLPDRKSSRRIIIACPVICFVLGLVGFTKLVEFLYPMQGYIGLIYLLCIIVNFLFEFKKNHSKCKKI